MIVTLTNEEAIMPWINDGANEGNKFIRNEGKEFTIKNVGKKYEWKKQTRTENERIWLKSIFDYLRGYGNWDKGV